MNHQARPDPALQLPGWSTPAEARRQLELEIDRFIESVAEATAEPHAALALRVTAGLGKTATALRVIAMHGQSLLARGHVLIYVPTLELAERAHRDFRDLAPELPSRVIRGRDAPRPDAPESKMCARASIAKAVAGFVPSVTRALCRTQNQEGNLVSSPCATGCPYLEQNDIIGPHIVFLSHAYLSAFPPIDRAFDVALRVIDEKVWPTLIRTSHLSVGDFMRAPSRSFPEGLHGVLSSARAVIIDGLQRNLPLHTHLRDHGIGAEQLQGLADAERQSRSYLEIGPGQSDQAVDYGLGTFDRKSFISSRRRESVFGRLAEKETGHCVGLGLFEKVADGGVQQVIESALIQDIERDAPLLLLDADADCGITERVVPGAEFISIKSPPVADIVQVSDVTLSNSWLLDVEFGRKRRAGVLAILEREIDRAAGDGVLVVATKPVLKALHTDLGQFVSDADEETLKQPLLGAVPRWFGPRTQGVNDYERYAGIVVIGRVQPGVTDVEGSVRAVCARDELPIQVHLSGPLPSATAKILMADGTEREVVTHAHPDIRVQAIIAQTRECGTLQAIARLRLVCPNRPKRVAILSNLPLPDFPITRLSTFAALERGLEHEPDWRGYLRLEKAFTATAGRPVRGTRLSAAGLVADLPLDFETEFSAERFRRGRTTPRLLSLCRRIAEDNDWPITPLLLRGPSGGQAVPAVTFEDQGRALPVAEALWPDFTPRLA